MMQNNTISGQKKSRIKKSLLLIVVLALSIIDSFSQNNLNCSLVGSWQEGPCYTVEVSDNYTFINNGCYLDILDTSDSSNIVLVTRYQTRGVVYDIKVRNTSIYLAINNIGLSILNISDITDIKEIGFSQSYGFYPKIELLSDRLYYSTYTDGLYLIDISNPEYPEILQKFKTDQTCKNFKIKDNYLFMLGGRDGLKIYDISKPDTLIEIYNIDDKYVTNIDIKDNYVCLAIKDSVLILDITTPSEPKRIAGIYLKYISECRFYKNMIILAGYGLYTVDFNDSANPILTNNSVSLHQSTKDMDIKENRIFIASEIGGLQIFNIDPLTDFKQYGFYKTNGISYSIAVKNEIAYVSQYYTGLQIINVSNPQNPYPIKSLDFDKPVTSIKVKENYLFCSNYGLRIFDISDPQNPVEINYFSIEKKTYKLKFINETIFLASGVNGLTILDISDLHNITKIKEIDTPGYVNDIDIKENLVFITEREGLRIIDISDMTNPVEIDFYSTLQSLSTIKIIGDFAYVGSPDYGLRIVDVSNLDSIFIVKWINTIKGYSILVKDSLAYVAAGNYGLVVFNITDIANPVIVGRYDTPGVVKDIALSGNHIFLADDNAGLSIVDFNKCGALEINSSKQDISCHGESDGRIQITGVLNKVGTVQYLWSNGQTSSTIENLDQGTYFVTISDANNCSITDTFNIEEPPELVIENITKGDITDTNKGYIHINISGGTPPYQYTWTGADGFTAASSNIDDIAAGCYTLTVTDANGCTFIPDTICIEDKTSSANEIDENISIRIYPNPANNYIYIKPEGKNTDYSIKKIEIYSTTAQIKKIFFDDFNYINTSDWKEGLHFIKVYTNKGIQIKKVLIVK